MYWKSIKKSGILFVTLVVIILYGIVYLEQIRIEKLLEESNTTIATVTNKSSGYRGSNSLYLEYKMNNTIYQPYGVQLDDCTDKFKIGDKVLIKYSLRDPRIVSIVECEKTPR